MEEWGYALGEDTCLFEDESGEEVSQAYHDEGQWDAEAKTTVDTMVENMAKGLEEEADTGLQAKLQVSTSSAGAKDRSVKGDIGISTKAEDANETRPDLVLDHHAGREDRVLGICGSPLVSGDQGSLKKGGQADRKRRKAEGVLRHTLSSLKKVARLPSKDRGEVLKFLKKSECRSKDRHGSHQSREVSRPVSSDVAASSESVTNDWKHWVFHRNGRLSKGINATFIALIPKVESPQRLNDFRPISLVGSLYKILAKVLANRLRLVMGSVISESHTAFVRDRQILDGILIANEGYLDAVMRRMGFPTLWRKWIKECVCTATASVLVNRSPTDEFPIERGLRQGDPLSPFLFLLAAEGLHVLMEALEEHNLFTGYRVGNSAPISVSHPQFADDTLLMGTKCWANVRALRVVLVLFETMLSLKVNFNKSMLVGVNISDSWLGEAASALGCRVGKIPFLYLGLPIGGDPRHLIFWEPVLTRLKRRLSGWKSRFLSFGGRLVLLKSVLTSLPVYALSFFKAPSGKWCWRMLVDREGLWFRVLAARYGVERGRVCVGGTCGSSWWREVARLRDGGGEAGGGWFEGNISRQVGDGSNTFFWTDPWVDGTPLCERFRRLFDLAVNKSDHVADMFQLGWGIGGDACGGDLCGRGRRNCWGSLLTAQDVVPLDAATDLIWHPRVPLKVSILAWRLLRDRLPTKVNLSYRGILPAGESHCVSGCGAVESAQHVFLSCSTFSSLWSLVSSWVGAASVTAQTLSDHFIQFSSSAGDTRVRRSFMQLLWLACVWVVWTERNHRLFRGSANSSLHMLDKIKTFSFRWLTAKSCTLALNYHSWWSSPMLCLGLY
ncbi:hypothetical protein TSUD_196650 [Trifolium subterraneum]|uniref:Reverse transcriptase domain-containing protein n=1 Tax=Trifolium subterraneum TaxID=3900 RepID=A0A2Z6ND15_TRISU|nr:hypothetical protein TSUD_196650 [Trifolium subterraneum]